MCKLLVTVFGWLDVLGFNATLTAKVISWWSVTHMCFLAFSYKYYILSKATDYFFSYALAEVRDKNTPERKFASNGSLTPNHQVMSLKCSPLSHPGGAVCESIKMKAFSLGTEQTTYNTSWICSLMPKL